MDPWFVIFLLFSAGTFFLYKSSHERHFLFFMLRTHYGIHSIRALGGWRPNFWKFLGDLGILASFSGLGAFYLSKVRESKRNLYVMMALLCLLAGFVADAGFFGKVALALVLMGFVLVARRIDRAPLNFLAVSLLIFLISAAFIPKAYFAVLLGLFGLPGLVIAALMQQAYDIILQGSMLPGVSPMLPSTQDGNIGVGFPGYDIFIPWWYALIAIIATFVPHELAHGILSAVHRVKVKTTGLLTFGALPLGAFVEPDEEVLKKKSSITRMHVFAAGSLANFITGIFCTILIALFMLAVNQLMYIDGVQVVGLEKGYPAVDVLQEGAVITALNGHALSNISAFENAAGLLKPGDLVELSTDRGAVSFNAAAGPSNSTRGYMGVLVREHMTTLNPGLRWLLTPTLLAFIATSLTWIIFFNVNIGLVNLLPLPPFDGYRMIEELIKSSIKDKDIIKMLIYILISIIVVIFIINMSPLVSMLLKPVFDFF
ncbi:MAG: M50 family metallopeptidase [Candidatus Altiarchaeota archaeon]|nr:M50 family metallopeptidase [Candidatus Altiarchaeota archaeon]